MLFYTYMKPKNKHEQRVMELRNKLPVLTDTQIKYAREHCFWHYGRLTKNHILCMDCGHRFAKGKLLRGGKCPACNRKLKLEENKKRTFGYTGVLRIIDRLEEFQVLRYFTINKYFRYGQLPQFSSIGEIVEHWISPGKEPVTVARIQRHNYGCYYTFSWYGDMEVRYYSRPLHEPGCITYPAVKFLPQIRYARKIPNRGWGYARYLSVIINPEAETIYKAGYIELFEVFPDRIKQIKRLWPAIKVAIRHKYRIDDPTLWLDYLDTIRFFRKDIRNPHFICPEDLRATYAKWYAKRRKVLDAKNLTLKEKRSIEMDIEYKKRIAKFAELKIMDGQLSIAPLPSVMEVLQEGLILEHCVYNKNYHKKPDCLLLSARLNGKRIGTVEYSLTERKVVQCRGKRNYPTGYNEKIIELVNRAMTRELAG